MADDGAFMSFLKWLGRPQKVAYNLLRGNFEGAGRQALDILGDAADAVLPGDIIPEFSREKEDNPEFTDVVGLSDMEDGFAKSALNFVGGVATDPLTYVGLGPIAKGAKMGAEAALAGAKAVAPSATAKATELVGGAIDKAAPYVSKAKIAAKDALGWLEPNDKVRSTIEEGRATASRAARSGGEEVTRIGTGLSPDEDRLAASIIHNVRKDEGGVWRVVNEDIGRRAGAIEDIDQQIATLRERATRHPGFQALDDAGKQRVLDAVEGAVKLGQTQFRNEVEAGALARPKQYTDPTGKTFMEDELREQFMQEKQLGDEIGRAGGRETGRMKGLGDDVEHLDERTQLVNDLANESSAAEAKTAAKLPLMITKQMRRDLSDMGYTKFEIDAMTPEQANKTLGRLSDTVLNKPDQATAGERVFQKEFGKQAREDQRLASRTERSADRLDDLQRKFDQIDPGEWKDFLARRGLNVSDLDVSRSSPRDYLMRSFEQTEQPLMRQAGDKIAEAAPTKARSLRTPGELAAFLNSDEGKALKFGESLTEQLAKRTDIHAQGLQRATLGRGTLGENFKSLVDGVVGDGKEAASFRSGMADAINTMNKTDPESARALMNELQGPGPRGPILNLLAKANRVFKPAAVYGVVIPKVGSIVSNAISGVWQTLSTQGAGAAWQQLKRTPGTLMGAFDEAIVKGFGLSRLPKGMLSKELDTIDQAFKASRGDHNAVLSILEQSGHPELAEAVRHGVLDGFVSSERIIEELAKHSSKNKRWWDLYTMPGEAFQGVESRMRLGNYLDQLKRGVDPAEAGRKVRETFLDYTVASGANRTLRDLIPFAAFTTGTIKQQSKFLAESPVALSSVSHLLQGGTDDPVYPWMEGKLNVPVGPDEQGNQQYISGFRLPFETMGIIPNPSASPREFGRQVERGIVGSAHPLLKSAFGLVSGEEPYTGQPYLGYSKMPVIGEAGGAGRAYNALASTGMIQPIDSPLQMLGDVFDERRSIPLRALDVLTGANVQTVDPDRAKQLQINELLATNPGVKQYRSFYQQGEKDPEIAAQLQQLREATKRAKKRGKEKAKED